MNAYKKVILIALGVVDLILLAMTIGYIVWGIQMPNTLAGREMQFMGAYILAITMGALVLIISAIWLILFFRWRKNNGKNI